MSNIRIRDLLDLADVQRRGWLARGVPTEDCESVAEHSQSVSLYCVLLAPEKDRMKAIELAVAHDVAEVITGDITPADQISAEEKQAREELAYQFLESVNPEVAIFRNLWCEYKENTTEAAKFVHDADKLQRLDKAFKYARKYPHLKFTDFKRDAEYIKNSDLRSKAEAILVDWERWDQENKTFIFVIGGPGVGKGTQCKMAAARLGAYHVSAGDLLRDEQSRPGSPFQKFIADSFEMNQPVPPSLIVELLQKAIKSQPQSVFLVDGFPRSPDQLAFFISEVSASYGTIQLRASDETLKRRLTHRATSSGREDDQPGKIELRIEAFSKSHHILIEELDYRKQPLCEIDGEAKAEEVQSEFLAQARAIIDNYEKD